MYNRHRKRYLARYALVHEEGGYEFLVDTHKLYGLSLITVRRGQHKCVVWIDEPEVEIEHSEFSEQETAAVKALAEQNADDLLMWFLTIRNDWKRDRLERNVLID